MWKCREFLVNLGFMKRKLLLLCSAGLVILSSAFTVVVNKSGRTFATGSPFDGGTCASCHSGGSTIPTISITTNPILGVGNTYTPGGTYTVNVTVAGSYAKFGFDIEILDSNSPSTVNDAGIIGATVSGNCQTYTFTGNPTNVTHTTPSGTAGSAVFSFLWTAPMAGDVYMYTAGIGANNNNAKTGDRVASTSLIASPGVATMEGYSADQGNFTFFPNPAESNLTISYELREGSKVSFALCNLSGQVIAELGEERTRPGQHQTHLHLPAVLAKGSYLLMMRVNGSEISRKLLVL